MREGGSPRSKFKDVDFVIRSLKSSPGSGVCLMQCGARSWLPRASFFHLSCGVKSNSSDPCVVRDRGSSLSLFDSECPLASLAGREITQRGLETSSFSFQDFPGHLYDETSPLQANCIYLPPSWFPRTARLGLPLLLSRGSRQGWVFPRDREPQRVSCKELLSYKRRAS